jgi:hypothetical protein
MWAALNLFVQAALKSLDLEPDPATLPGDSAEFSFLTGARGARHERER